MRSRTVFAVAVLTLGLLHCSGDDTATLGGGQGGDVIGGGSGLPAGSTVADAISGTTDAGTTPSTSQPDVEVKAPDFGVRVTDQKDEGQEPDTREDDFPYPCVPGEKEPCLTACGAIGERQCLKFWGSCHPPEENCENCFDDDCDGVINNGCTSDFECPDPPQEQCNCIDDDLNGEIDEGCHPKPVCDKEPCDCLDNDGDGKVDEGCPWWWFCDAEQECDCIDNDGDGQIDESCDPLPATCPGEICDCIDNDGDGEIDEDCSCVPGTWRWCDDPVYCSWGKQTCLPNGQWAVCREVRGEAPPGCENSDPVGFGPDEYIALYDTNCCVDSGECCQNYPANDSVGICQEFTCP